MIVSTKGRYALRVMIDLAEHEKNTQEKVQRQQQQHERRRLEEQW